MENRLNIELTDTHVTTRCIISNKGDENTPEKNVYDTRETPKAKGRTSEKIYDFVPEETTWLGHDMIEHRKKTEYRSD